MNTLRQFAAGIETVPATTAWYLADLGEARGKQELFMRQSPQMLRVLREYALIESAISSNRIEGVVVDQKRIGTIVFGRSHLRDRNEEEVRGYRDSLKRIHELGTKLPVSERTIRDLHRLSRSGLGDAGRYKQKDSDIIEKLPGGRVRARFKTVPATETGP
jgi:Fic family protein